MLKPPPRTERRPTVPHAVGSGEPVREESPTPPVPAASRGAWIAAAITAPAVAAAVFAFTTPRGPISATEGLVTMGAALAVGLVAGVGLRSRWAILLAPLTFAAAFEAGRVGTDGPTVDGIHLSAHGMVALATGRGVHGLVSLVPLALGASLGAGLTRTRDPHPPRGGRRATLYARRAAAGLVGAGLVLLAVTIARPASTDAILGPNGEPLPGSIAELTRVDVGEHELAIMIRGHSTESPVLLFLAGGPGGSELGAMRRHLPALEEDFVVATWDQRGTGKSYGELDPVSSLTLENAVQDAVEVTNYLRERFGRERIYVVGQSWGSLLGVLAVERHPELYEAFVGVGQMVSPRETDRIFYRDTLAWAHRTSNDGLVATLERIGPPPYERMPDYATLLAYEKDVYPYDRSGNSEGAGQMGENIFVEEYTLLEQLHVFAGVLDTFSALYPQLQDIDFRRDAAELAVPVYLVQGRNEARGRAEPASEWFRMLRAPRKRMVVFETSGHRPLFEQPERFHAVMRGVLADRRSSR